MAPSVPPALTNVVAGWIPTFDPLVTQGIIAGVLFIIIGITVFFILKKNPLKRWPVTIKVNEHLKNGQKNTEWTKGRISGKFGQFREYELKNGDKTRIPSYQSLTKISRGKFFLELDKFEDGRYSPHIDKFREKVTKTGTETVLEPNPNPLDKDKLIPVNKDREYAQAIYDIELNHDDVNYLVQTFRENFEKFKSASWWKRYGLEIAIMFVIFSAIMLVYGSVQYGAIPVLEDTQVIAGQNTRAIELLSNATEKWIYFTDQQFQIIREILAELRAFRNATVIL